MSNNKKNQQQKFQKPNIHKKRNLKEVVEDDKNLKIKRSTQKSDSLLDEELDASNEYEVERILEKKVENNQVFYKVKWKGWDNKYNTWEPDDHLFRVVDLVMEFESRRKYQKKGKSVESGESDNEESNQYQVTCEADLNTSDCKESDEQQNEIQKNLLKNQKKNTTNINENLNSNVIQSISKSKVLNKSPTNQNKNSQDTIKNQASKDLIENSNKNILNLDSESNQKIQKKVPQKLQIPHLGSFQTPTKLSTKQNKLSQVTPIIKSVESKKQVNEQTEIQVEDSQDNQRNDIEIQIINKDQVKVIQESSKKNKKNSENDHKKSSNVNSINSLNQIVDNPVVVESELIQVEEEEETEYVFEAILAKRQLEGQEVEYLMKFQNQDQPEWEFLSNLEAVDEEIKLFEEELKNKLNSQNAETPDNKHQLEVSNTSNSIDNTDSNKEKQRNLDLQTPFKSQDENTILIPQKDQSTQKIENYTQQNIITKKYSAPELIIIQDSEIQVENEEKPIKKQQQICSLKSINDIMSKEIVLETNKIQKEKSNNRTASISQIKTVSLDRSVQNPQVISTLLTPFSIQQFVMGSLPTMTSFSAIQEIGCYYKGDKRCQIEICDKAAIYDIQKATFKIKWKPRHNGYIPQPTFVSYQMLKEHDLAGLVVFYESLLTSQKPNQNIGQLPLFK